MSIPNEALQKVGLQGCALPNLGYLTDARQLLQEIEQKAAFSRQQITLVKMQIAAKNRESRMMQLTTNELDSLQPDTKIYEGVGKM